METLGTIKSKACQALAGNWVDAALAAFIYLLVYIVLYSVVYIVAFFCIGSENVGDLLANIVSLALLPLSYGLSVFCLLLHRSGTPKLAVLFEGYKDFRKVFGTKFLQGLFTILWLLLLIIPGIVKSYSYAMTDFVLRDNPELSCNGAIERSMALMQGHKMKLFLLDLSLIGWAILSLFTLGIGFFWLIPYRLTAFAEFYKELLDEENTEKQL